MKLTKMTFIAIIVITTILLTGCQDEQLSQCRMENGELQKMIESQQLELRKMGSAMMDSSTMVSVFMTENEKLANEVEALKKAAQQAPPKPQDQKKPEQKTPDEKASLQKGLQDLFEMQRKSAEQMKKEKQESQK